MGDAVTFIFYAVDNVAVIASTLSVSGVMAPPADYFINLPPVFFLFVIYFQ